METTNLTTGEILSGADPYAGASTLRITEDQRAILWEPLTDADVEIRPDGLLYFPEVRYRRRLNKAFGPGGWSIIPAAIDQKGGELQFTGRLYIAGCFVSEAIGGAKLYDSTSYATAAESAKSNAIVRLCKDLGIASELWDPSYAEGWRNRFAIRVWCKNVGSGRDAGKKQAFWRKRDAERFSYPWEEEDQRRALADPSRRPAPRQLPAASAVPVDPAPARVPEVAREDDRNRAAATAPEAPPPAGARDREPAAAAVHKITLRQVNRFRKIATSSGYSSAELEVFLQRAGYPDPTGIPLSDYDRITGALSNPKLLADIRAQAAGGAPARAETAPSPTGPAPAPEAPGSSEEAFSTLNQLDPEPEEDFLRSLPF
jgi:hypothetical protein